MNSYYQYPLSYQLLNDGQREAFDQLVAAYEDGTPCFVTGNAGTGKSFLANAYDEFCRINRISLAKCAPTGIAATAIGGATMHRLFKLPLGVSGDELESDQYENVRQKLAYADAIWIDEVSMARVDHLDCVLRQIWKASEIRKRRGKRPVQIVVCGDFGQLAPVITGKDRDDYEDLVGMPIGKGYCYAGAGWKFMKFKPVVLTEPMRQADPEFCAALDLVKMGDPAGIEFMNARTARAPIDDAVWVCGYNKTALDLNMKRLAALPGRLYEHEAIIQGDADISKTNLEPSLAFKEGARIMMLINDREDGRYCNGSLGRIQTAGRGYVTVRLDNGRMIYVQPMTLEFYDYQEEDGVLVKKCVGSITQYPFKLGYAVTIHKAQGQTYEAANLVPEIFAAGQLYVGLSRCRTAKTLYIQPDRNGRKLLPKHVIADKDTIGFLDGVLSSAKS